MGINELMMNLRIIIPFLSILDIFCSDSLFELSVELAMIDMAKSLSV